MHLPRNVRNVEAVCQGCIFALPSCQGCIFFASLKVNNILHMQLPQNVGSSITECLPRVCVCIIYTVYVCPVCVCQPAASNELAPQDNCRCASRIVAAEDCTTAAQQCPLCRSCRAVSTVQQQCRPNQLPVDEPNPIEKLQCIKGERCSIILARNEFFDCIYKCFHSYSIITTASHTSI